MRRLDLSEVDLRWLAAQLGRSHALWLGQRPGDVVLVEPGWLHVVVNHAAASVKLSFERFEARSVGACLLMQRRLRCRLGRLNMEDHSRLAGMVLRELAAWHRHSVCGGGGGTDSGCGGGR